MRDVGTVMWPHVDEEYANKSLTINLHRLRKALGSDDSISLRDGRLSVNTRRVSLDIDAFGQIVNAIQESIRGRSGVGDLDELAESLFGIYKGLFLPGVDGHQCLIDARERYRESFVEAVRALRDAYQRRGDRERSYDVLRRGLSRDLQSAELRADLIALFRSDGDSGSAKAVIEDYQHQLFTEGAGGLPADLKALYAEITNTEERES